MASKSIGQEKKNIVHTKEEKETRAEKKISASEKSERNRRDLLFLGFALFVVFLVLFWILQNSPKPTVQTLPTKKSNIEDFKVSLLNAESMLIVENVTDLTSGNARYVYACGAGLAGSWGKIGKNISSLYIYVIDGNECTFSSPSITNNELSNESTVTTTEECMNRIAEMQKNDLAVTFEIRYGPLYSIYETNKAYLFVNEDFTEECSFRLSESSTVIGTSQ